MRLILPAQFEIGTLAGLIILIAVVTAVTYMGCIHSRYLTVEP